MYHATKSEWCHLILSTYGAWLPGDPRGFRTWHEHEHIDGDYKQPPPPGKYAARHQRSRGLLKEAAVALSPKWRKIIGEALVERLQALGVLVLCVSVSREHAHLLAKMPPGDARVPLGQAKRHAWFEARRRGWQGRLWAVRPGIKRVRNRAHQLSAFRYIIKHAEEGAWVWTWHPDMDA